MTETMTIDERRKYLKVMKVRYDKAVRKERGMLLQEAQAVTGLRRETVNRLLLRDSLDRRRREARTGARYGLAVRHVVQMAWQSLDCVCAERLTPALVSTARQLDVFKVVHLTADIEAQLATISVSTVGRMLKDWRPERPRLPRKGPGEASAARKAVPMGRMPWDITEPGHFETDLVHHCGPATVGDYVHTLQMVDAATGWSERVAVPNRGQAAMIAGFERIVARMPMAIKEVHPDNGSEFFSANLLRFFGEAVQGVHLSRSRPYQKNDNRKVEQKNNTLVRAYLGDVRLEGAEQTAALNALYDDMWVYYNLFQPVLHLTGKEVVGGKLRREWDRAQTPYERLCASGVLGDEQRKRLDALYAATNPLALRDRIYAQLERLWEAGPVAATA